MERQPTKAMTVDAVLFPEIVIFTACCPPWQLLAKCAPAALS